MALLTTSFYPVNDFGSLMKGLIIGGMGIFHVFTAYFAIGGGVLMCYFEWLAQTEREPAARRFLEGYFKVLVLVSFVIGALTGVGMWFTSIQISPQTIGLMVQAFHWVWAIEWLFFWLEVVAGYIYLRYGARLTPRQRLLALATYSVAGWGSLFWINGILSWQLTPGEWVRNQDVWSGFFNPSFWPSLLYRTVATLSVGALAAMVIVNTIGDLGRLQKRRLMHRAVHLMLPMVSMPFVGAWFLHTMPADSRSWVMGGSVAMTLFLALAVGATFVLGAYAIVGLWRSRLYISGPTATLLLGLAFVASAGGEFVREGARKPYTVRQVLYSNAIKPDEVARLRRIGGVSEDPYPLHNPAQYPNAQLRLGAQVYRAQCSICHTQNGSNGLTHLTGSWLPEQMRSNIARLQHTKAFMPPFAGNAAELEALVQLLSWENADRPRHWPVMEDPRILAGVDAALRRAGTAPGNFHRYQRGR